MVELKSTRTALGDALLEIAQSGADMAAVAADTSKSMCTAVLREKYPRMVYDCGIAEQNMMMIAAGLAASGKIAFAASYSVFTSMRAAEQLRTFICYPRLNVKVLAGIGGLSGGIEGTTHIAMEDLGIVRCMPNITIVAPADYYSAKQAVIESSKTLQPTYIRVGRDPSPVIYDQDYSLNLEKANTVIDKGNEIGIISNGLILHQVLEAAQRLERKGYGIKVMDMPVLKPADRGAVIKMAKEVKFLFTAEEHNITGGLFSTVSEILSAEYPVRVYPIAVPDIFIESGTPCQLARKYRLDGRGIAERIEEITGRDHGLRLS